MEQGFPELVIGATFAGIGRSNERCKTSQVPQVWGVADTCRKAWCAGLFGEGFSVQGLPVYT